MVIMDRALKHRATEWEVFCNLRRGGQKFANEKGQARDFAIAGLA
jgi:hypothetical protein